MFRDMTIHDYDMARWLQLQDLDPSHNRDWHESFGGYVWRGLVSSFHNLESSNHVTFCILNRFALFLGDALG